MNEDYWLDSEAEECNVREKARKMGLDREKVDDLLRQHPDAFEITTHDLEKLLEDKK